MTAGRAVLPLPVPLVRPVADEWEWQAQARCRTMDTNLFFHPDQERGEARRRREERAKQICGECPVVAECAAFALLAGERFGVWGGVSETERLLALGLLDRRTAGAMGTKARRDARRAGLSPTNPQ